MSDLAFTTIEHQLVFDDVEFPRVVFRPDSVETASDTCAFIKSHQAQLEQTRSSGGAILFRSFPLPTALDFDAFVMAFGYPNFTQRDLWLSTVERIYTERVFSMYELSDNAEIGLLSQMAHCLRSPDTVFLFCLSAAQTGGETTLCRSDQLFYALEELDPLLASELESKGLRHTIQLPAANSPDSSLNRTWKSTLNVDSIEQAEQTLSRLGYQWFWQVDGSIKAVTPILPAVLRLESGVKVFSNQLIAAHLSRRGMHDRPASTLCFGDGTKITNESLELITELAKAFTFDLQWKQGDVVLIDNKMTMHGKRAYSGEHSQQILVAMS